MKYLLSILGAALSLVGVLGLWMFGASLLEVMLGVMAPQSETPLPSSLSELKWAALGGIALSLGLALSCVATSMRGKGKSHSLVGRILYVAAGVLVLVGVIPWLWGTLTAWGGFQTLASQEAVPTEEALQAIVAGATAILPVGDGMLLIAILALLAASQVGTQQTPSEVRPPASMLSRLAALASLLIGGMVALLFVSVLGHGNDLAMTLQPEGTSPRPAELASHLNGMLTKTLLAWLAIALQGILQALAGFSAPRVAATQQSGELQS